MTRVVVEGRLATPSMHHGMPVWREAGTHPITLAKVPVTGDKLEESVLLRPDYVPRGVERELVQLDSFRRGRTIDVFLDEPIEIGGKPYTLLNFKGVGADADQPMAIRRDDWWVGELGRGHWGWNEEQGERMWGAMKTDRAEKAFSSTVLANLAAPEIGYVACNPIPEKILPLLHPSEPLSQIVRAYNTNMRHDDPFAYTQLKDAGVQFDPVEVAEQDAAMFNNIRKLAEQGKMLIVGGSIAGNRMLTGEFIDRQNYWVESAAGKPGQYLQTHMWRFIGETIDTSQKALGPEAEKVYNAHLRKKVTFSVSHML